MPSTARRAAPTITSRALDRLHRTRDREAALEAENARLRAENAELRDLVHQRLEASGEPYWQGAMGDRLDPLTKRMEDAA